MVQPPVPDNFGFPAGSTPLLSGSGTPAATELLLHGTADSESQLPVAGLNLVARGHSILIGFD